ncbi:sugar phosphate isomerase/epimerase [bacterium]|nr:sugar phosphate isomerase/epimerase [bacterium]
MQRNRPLGVSTSLFRSTLGPNSELDGIRALQGTRISHIEYFCDESDRDRTNRQRLAAVKRAAADCGVSIWSCHAPFGTTDISDRDDSVRLASAQCVIETLDAAVELSAGRVVVHGSREPIVDEERPQRLDLCIRSLSELARQASRRGIALALELLPRTCLGNRSAEMRYILDHVDGDVRVCFDVNHITLYEGAREALGALGTRIETLHISDHDGVDERHWVPGKGVVDWADFVAGLDDIGYQGCLMHEARDTELDLAGNLNAIGQAAGTYLTL